MTKQTNWNGKEVLLVEVEPDAVYVESELYNKETLQPAILVFTIDLNGLFKPGIPYTIPIPDDSWQFAFADPLHPTDEEAKEWVEWYSEKPSFVGDKSKTFYMDYETGALLIMIATASLHSRIRSEGFEHPERVIMLIKK